MSEIIENYNLIRHSAAGFYQQDRGLFEVSGGEAVQFLDGLVTNDMKTLEDGSEMRAAFPNAKGRLLAIVGVLRKGDSFYFETEETTKKSLFDNLFRFTYAGDFHVKDLSDEFVSYQLFGDDTKPNADIEGRLRIGRQFLIPKNKSEEFEQILLGQSCVKISDDLYELLRIEHGIPKYGVDIDEETVVPEVGLDGLISYKKGCYIGQEVIARIHFRGHVAKQLTGLVFEDLSEPSAVADGLIGEEIKSLDDKNAGKITSVTFSPKLGKVIALAYVRYAFLEEGTNLKVSGHSVKVKNLPFFE